MAARGSGLGFKKRVVLAAGVGLAALVPLVADPAGAASFANSTPINGQFLPPDVSPANPYPSNISVSGLSGTVSDVNVTLCGLGATFPSDTDVLLVAPGGTQAMIMSDVGGNGNDTGAGADVPVSGVTLTLDDQAASPLPGGPTLVAGTFRPIDDDNEVDGNPFDPVNADRFVVPAPTLGSNVALSSFNGISPNGTWSLYVVDDYAAQASDGEFVLPNFSCGWSLNVTTGGGGGGTATRIGVFRPSTGQWFFQSGAPAVVNFGTTGDIAVTGDYDGNGSSDDVAVFRPSQGVWYHSGSAAAAWGTSGDIPVPADYNGNGTTDRAVFRPSTGTWFVQGGATVNFGTSGDIPVPGDYDGNGTDDMAVFRPSTGQWFINGGSPAVVNFGTSGDIPVPGDYNGNGTTDVAVFRPSTGVWFVNGGTSVAFGASGDIPVPGDYDANGTTDRAVFRPSTGTWFVHGGTTVAFGTSGDHPVPLPSAIRQVFFP